MCEVFVSGSIIQNVKNLLNNHLFLSKLSFNAPFVAFPLTFKGSDLGNDECGGAASHSASRPIFFPVLANMYASGDRIMPHQYFTP